MVPPIPVEHRQEIVKLRDSGYSFRDIREIFLAKGITYSVIGIGNCYQKILRNGSIDAQPKQKYSKEMLDKIKLELQNILEENSDLTGQQQIEEIKKRLGVSVSMDAVGRYRRLLGWKIVPSSSVASLTTTTTTDSSTITSSTPSETTTTTTTTSTNSKTTSRTCIQTTTPKSINILRCQKSPDEASTSSNSNSSNIFSDSSLGGGGGGGIRSESATTTSTTTNLGGGGGVLQIVRSSADMPCGFILSGTDSVIGHLQAVQQQQQQKSNNINDILPQSVLQTISSSADSSSGFQTATSSILGASNFPTIRSSADSTLLFETLRNGSGITDLINENQQQQQQQQQQKLNGFGNRFGMIQEDNLLLRGFNPDSSGEDGESTIKINEEQLKVVRDYLTSASTSAELQHLQSQQQQQQLNNGVVVGTEEGNIKAETTTTDMKRFYQQNQLELIAKPPPPPPLSALPEIIRFGPNHVFTSRSFIRAGFDGSLKYQVWAGISFLGATSICIWDAECRMKSTFYCSTILDKFFLPFRDERYGHGQKVIIVQNGNDSIYRSNETKSFMQRNNIGYDLWTHQSNNGEKNPIEAIWEEISSYVRQEIRPDTLDQLREAICQFWATKMTDSKCRTCIRKCSMFSENFIQ